MGFTFPMDDVRPPTPYYSSSENYTESDSDSDDPEWVPCGECECSQHLDELEDITAEASLKYIELVVKMEAKEKELQALRAVFFKIATIMREFADENS